jgi:RNA polymerase sigma-70 factor (family 1)
MQTEDRLLNITETAFTRIYLRYWGTVYGVCQANIEDAELSKEMAQEIFKSLWERRNTLDEIHSVERYLVRSAKMKVFEYLRNDRIRSAHLKAIAYQQHGSNNATERDVQWKFLSRQLSDLVTRLPEQGRRIFSMSREMGLSNREIASSLKVTERQVEYQLTKTLRYLRDNLREYAVSFGWLGPIFLFFCYF